MGNTSSRICRCDISYGKCKAKEHNCVCVIDDLACKAIEHSCSCYYNPHYSKSNKHHCVCHKSICHSSEHRCICGIYADCRSAAHICICRPGVDNISCKFEHITEFTAPPDYQFNERILDRAPSYQAAVKESRLT